MRYSITEVAERMALTPSTIRYYEHEGLLPGIQRTTKGTRYFTDTDIERINLVCCLKKTGLSLKNIKDCLSLCDGKISSINERLEIFTSHRQYILSEIEELEKYLIQVDDKIETLHKKKEKTIDESSVPLRLAQFKCK